MSAYRLPAGSLSGTSRAIEPCVPKMIGVGDLNNTFKKMKAILRSIKYPVSVKEEGLFLVGETRAFLPVLHFIFLGYNYSVTNWLVLQENVPLKQAASDHKFVDNVYKIMAKVFRIARLPLSKEQFFLPGFTEKKMQLMIECASCIKNKAEELLKQKADFLPSRYKLVESKVKKELVREPKTVGRSPRTPLPSTGVPSPEALSCPQPRPEVNDEIFAYQEPENLYFSGNFRGGSSLSSVEEPLGGDQGCPLRTGFDERDKEELSIVVSVEKREDPSEENNKVDQENQDRASCGHKIEGGATEVTEEEQVAVFVTKENRNPSCTVQLLENNGLDRRRSSTLAKEALGEKFAKDRFVTVLKPLIHCVESLSEQVAALECSLGLVVETVCPDINAELGDIFGRHGKASRRREEEVWTLKGEVGRLSAALDDQREAMMAKFREEESQHTEAIEGLEKKLKDIQCKKDAEICAGRDALAVSDCRVRELEHLLTRQKTDLVCNQSHLS